MRKCANISPYMRRPFVIYGFATAPFWISLYVRENSIFFFIRVTPGTVSVSSSVCLIGGHMTDWRQRSGEGGWGWGWGVGGWGCLSIFSLLPLSSCQNWDTPPPPPYTSGPILLQNHYPIWLWWLLYCTKLIIKERSGQIRLAWELYINGKPMVCTVHIAIDFKQFFLSL